MRRPTVPSISNDRQLVLYIFMDSGARPEKSLDIEVPAFEEIGLAAEKILAEPCELPGVIAEMFYGKHENFISRALMPLNDITAAKLLFAERVDNRPALIDRIDAGCKSSRDGVELEIAACTESNWS